MGVFDGIEWYLERVDKEGAISFDDDFDLQALLQHDKPNQLPTHRARTRSTNLLMMQQSTALLILFLQRFHLQPGLVPLIIDPRKYQYIQNEKTAANRDGHAQRC